MTWPRLPLELLKSIKTIVTHKNCPDGIASAMILKDALPKAEVLFVQHETEIHRNLPVTEGMLFCDFAPCRDRVPEFVAAKAIVLDHHKGQKDIVAQFGPLGVFADEKDDPGIAGATLAYREVWVPLCHDLEINPKKDIKDFATLAGIRDTWQTKNPRWNESKEQAAYLMFFGEDECLKWPIFEGKEKWDFRHQVGKLLSDEHERKVAKTLEGAYRTVIHGLKVVIHQGVTHTSDAAEMLGDDCGVDILAGFSYFGEDNSDREDWSPNFGKNLKMIVSTRTRTSFDVSKLAKFYGGGGHTKAAGFSVMVKEDHMNPYTKILSLIHKYMLNRED